MLGIVASNWEISYTFDIVGATPEKAWVGIELENAAKTNNIQFT